MTKDEMIARTKEFALRIINLVNSLPKTDVGKVLGHQLLRCGTSVGANYRAACRGKSTADFIHKLTIVEEVADESLYWMELVVEAGLLGENRVNPLHKEGEEILAIVVSAIKTMKKKRLAVSEKNPKSDIPNPKSK